MRVDHLLPTNSNPSYRKMRNNPQANEMIAELTHWRNWKDNAHFLLSGPAERAKTSLGFAVAAEKYMVYLKCPSQAIIGHGLGYMMAGAVWTPNQQGDHKERYRITTVDGMQEFLYAEIISRLVVLLDLLEKNDPAVSTPLLWLEYVISHEGGQHIHETYVKVADDKPNCTDDDVFPLLRNISKIVGYRPMLMIDQLHAIKGLPSLHRELLNKDGIPVQKVQTILELFVGSLWRLSCPVILSGIDCDKVPAPRLAQGRRGLIVWDNFSWAEELETQQAGDTY